MADLDRLVRDSGLLPGPVDQRVIGQAELNHPAAGVALGSADPVDDGAVVEGGLGQVIEPIDPARRPVSTRLHGEGAFGGLEPDQEAVGTGGGERKLVGARLGLARPDDAEERGQGQQEAAELGDWFHPQLQGRSGRGERAGNPFPSCDSRRAPGVTG